MHIDETWYIGPFHIDICGGAPWNEVHFGVVLSFDRNPANCWGRRLTIHFGFWALSFGYDVPIPDERGRAA